MSVSSLVFLAFGGPWPAYSGNEKRVLNLLTELARAYPIDLRLLLRDPLTDMQAQELGRYAQYVRQIPRRDSSLGDRIAVAIRAIRTRVPYHVSVVEHSLSASDSVQALRPQPSHWVYANLLHWTAPLRREAGPRWIVDQQNADVHFWDVYARHSPSYLVRLVASANHHLTCRYCSDVYPNIGRIVSVCEEDCALTRQLSPGTPVDVIPNGVDCDHFSPNRPAIPAPRLLFTGTSDQRNMVALRSFVRQVYPLVCATVPEVELVIGGNFDLKSQSEFADCPGISFTGKVPDLRPTYNRCAVFVNPFDEAYGSKLKVSEALAMGICLVSTPAGARGMPVVDEESVLIGRDGPHMAQQIMRALTDSELARRIGDNGRRVAEVCLDWQRVLGPRLRRMVAQTAGQDPLTAK